MARVFIGLGSNLENPVAQLEQAFVELAVLPQTRLRARSRLYSSRALGPVQPDYVNAVAELETDLAPLALLDQLQALEQAHRRVRLEHWGPRTLDLDILLFGDRLIDEPRLKVPHYHMHARAFVLYPLAELAPADLRLADGRLLKDLLAACPFVGLERLPSN